MPLALFAQNPFLRRAAGLGLGLLSLGVAAPSWAGSVNWDTAAGDWYASPSHWSNGATPGSGDDAVNNSTAAMTLGQDATVHSFFSNGAFSLNGGTFSGSQAAAASLLTVNNVFTVNGGGISNFTVNQGTGGSLVFAGNGGNNIRGSVINSGMDLATNANAYLDLYGAVTETGAIALGTTSNGIRLVDSGTTLTLSSTGSLTGFGSVYQYNGNTFTNGGTINANSSTNALTLAVSQLNNSGIAEATKGATLSFNSTNVANAGTIRADGAGSIAALSGTITNGANSLYAATGGGQIQVNGAELLGTINTDAKTALVFNGNGANNINYNTAAGTVATVNGSLDLSTNANAYLDLYRTVNVNGAITLGTTSNGIRLVDSGTVLTLGSASSLTGFGSVYQYNGNTFTSNGLINADSKGSALNLALTTFNNNGMTEATNGGILNLNNTSTINSGTLKADGAGSVVTLVGTVTNGANSQFAATNGGQIQVNGATLLGTINGTSGTSLIFNGSGFNNINGATVNTNLDLATHANAYLDLYGAVTETGAIALGTTSNGIRLVDSGTTLTLSSTGSLTGFGSVYQYNANTFTNNGLIDATSASHALNLAVTTFNNNGTAEAMQGATLSLQNTTTNNNGTLKADGTGSVVSLTASGTVINGVNSLFTATNGGQVQVNGAELLGTINTDAKTALVFNGNGANNINYNTAAGAVATVNGNLDLATNKNAYLDLYRVVNVNGAITLGTTSNGIRLVDTGTVLTLSNAASLTGFGTVYQYNGNTFTSNGLINADSKGNALNLALTTFNNNGTTEATNGGVLNLNNTVTNNSGTLAAKSGGIVNIAGNETFTGTAGSLLDGAGGTINVTGADLRGTLTGTTGTSLVFDGNGFNNINYGTAVGTAATVNTNLDLATHTNAYLDLYDKVTETGAITLGTTSNGIRLVDSGTVLTLGNTGSLTGFGRVYQYNNNTFTNNGLINANSAAAPLDLALTTFNNNGTTEATKGATLNLQNTNTNAGDGSTLAATGSGSVVTIGGTFTGAGSNLITATGGGQVQVNGADLLGTINTDAKTALVFNGNGANNINYNTAAGTVATVNGNLDLATNTNAYLDLYRAVDVNGAIALGTTSNGIRLVDSGTVLTIGNAGSLSGFGSVYQYNANAVANNGLINANSAGNTLTIATSSFSNAGTTQVTSGAALNVTSGSAASSGTVNVQSGGTATFGSGLTQTAGLAQVDGALNAPFTMTGGLLKGTGTITGPVVNSGGTVAAGEPLGTLTVSGNYTQGAGGTLNEQFTNTAASLLSVSGLVTTDGTLDVNYLDTANYTGGTTPFTFLSYGTLATTGTNALGLTQYFTNETALTNDTGTILGHNGFTYELINNTAAGALQLEVLIPGAPVPETSSVVSLAVLLGLGGVGLWSARRRPAARR